MKLVVKWLLIVVLSVLAMPGHTKAQCDFLCNTDFENNQVTQSVTILNQVNVPCWNTTAPDQNIEVWHTGFNGVPSYSGLQFIELNAYYVSTLYQNFTISPGTNISVSFAHRGRAGTDTMSVSIGPVGGPYVVLGTYGDGNTAWGYYTVNYTIPPGPSNYSIRFNSVYAAGGNQAIGNFLDAISATMVNSYSIATTYTNAGCGGSGNGAAEVVNCAGCSYTWSPSGGNSATASNLAPGVYTVNTYSPGGCYSSSTVSITGGGSISYSLTQGNVLCNGQANGSATITNCSSCSYTWSPGGNSSTVSGLSAGSYSVAVSSGGCTSNSTFTITQPQVLNAAPSHSNISCYGSNNGAASVSVSGGTPGYTYTWSPAGGNGAAANGLSAGSYTVSIKDANSCTQSATVSITQPSSLTLSVNTSSIACAGQSTGSATATVSGGLGSYTYTWLPTGGNAASATSLAAGNYTVTAKDANNCSITQTLNIAQPSGSVTIATSHTDVACYGGATGAAAATANGPSPSYSYSWTHNSAPAGNTASISALPAGLYSVTVQDGSGCSYTSTVQVNQPNALSVNVPATQVCNGQQATVTATVSGGTLPYTYQWLPMNSSGTSIAVTPTASIGYTLNVTDNNNCPVASSVFTVTVLSPLAVAVSGPSLVCVGASASLTAVASGGNGNYQYTWQPGGLSGPNVNPVITTNTQYTVTVTDGCTIASAQNTLSVATLSTPVISPLSTKAAGCPTLCVQFYDSTLTQSGLVVSWHWNFSNGATSSVSSPVICFNQSGSYTGSVSVTTNNGCTTQPAATPGVTVYPAPHAAFDANFFETTLIAPDFQLSNTSTGASQVYWTLGPDVYTTNTVLYSATKEGSWPVTLTAINTYGCRDSVTTLITVKPDFTFYAPNAFTPNQDINNESFLPMGVGWKDNTYQLSIFDRWGSLIFSTSDVYKGWNGRLKNNDAVQQDLYVWKVELDDIYNKHHSYVGSVLVLR